MSPTSESAGRDFSEVIILALVVVFAFFVLLIMSLRLWVRMKNKNTGWDDWMMLAATVNFLAWVPLVAIMYDHHDFREAPSLQFLSPEAASDEMHQISIRGSVFSTFDASITLWCRLSIGFQFLRMLARTNERLRLVTTLVMILQALCTFATIFILWSVCSSVGSEESNKGHCLDPKVNYVWSLASLGFGLLVILFFVIAPMPTMLRLQRSLWLRIRAFILFTIFSLSGVFIIVRMYYWTTDVSIQIRQKYVLIFSLSESFVFILCGSASTLRQWWIMIKDNRARNSVYVGGSSTRQLVPISGPVPANREMNIIELISLENGFDRTRY